MGKSSSFLSGPFKVIWGSFASGCLAWMAVIGIHYGRIPNPTLPHLLGGDALGEILISLGIRDDGFANRISGLSAPFGLNTSDFRGTDWTHFALRKLLFVFGSDPILNSNLFYFLGYFLAAGVAAATFLVLSPPLRLRTLPAIFAGVIFAFLPYHFSRRYYHLLLTGYYLVPLLFILLEKIWWHLIHPMPAKDEELSKQDFIIAVLIGLALSGSGAYYAVYSFALIALATMISKIWNPVRSRFFDGRTLYGFTAGLAVILGITFQMLPGLMYQKTAGKNPHVVERTVSDFELHSTTPMLLFGPHHRHPIPSVDRWRDDFFLKLPERGEYDWGGSIGLLPALGLLFLWLGSPLIAQTRFKLLFGASQRLTLAAYLFAAVGGLASLLGLTKSFPLRAHSRIAPFLGAFGVLVFFLVLEKIREQSKPSGRRWSSAALAAITLLALFEQTPPGVQEQTPESEVLAYQKYFDTLSSALPSKAKIFHLPVSPYPENSYDPGIPLLFSQNFVSSGLPMRGREPLNWQYWVLRSNLASPCDELSQLAASAQLECLSKDTTWIKRLKLAGFSGVLLDRFGVSPQVDAIAKAFLASSSDWASSPLEIIEGGPRLDGHTPRYLFLRFGSQLRTPPEPWASQFYANSLGWRWHQVRPAPKNEFVVTQESTLYFLNAGPKPSPIRLILTTQNLENTANSRVKLQLKSEEFPLFDQEAEIEVQNDVKNHQLHFEVPVGQSSVRFIPSLPNLRFLISSFRVEPKEGDLPW